VLRVELRSGRAIARSLQCAAFKGFRLPRGFSSRIFAGIVKLSLPIHAAIAQVSVVKF
jgi:hypothetical protein